MVESQRIAIEAAIRSGALIRYRVLLEPGELDNRMLWMRPEIHKLMASDGLDPAQRTQVRVTLRRFVLGGPFTVVTADCAYQEVSKLGDIRELKGPAPPFVELRFEARPTVLWSFHRFGSVDSHQFRHEVSTTSYRHQAFFDSRRAAAL